MLTGNGDYGENGKRERFANKAICDRIIICNQMRAVVVSSERQMVAMAICDRCLSRCNGGDDDDDDDDADRSFGVDSTRNTEVVALRDLGPNICYCDCCGQGYR